MALATEEVKYFSTFVVVKFGNEEKYPCFIAFKKVDLTGLKHAA